MNLFLIWIQIAIYWKLHQATTKIVCMYATTIMLFQLTATPIFTIYVWRPNTPCIHLWYFSAPYLYSHMNVFNYINTHIPAGLESPICCRCFQTGFSIAIAASYIYSKWGTAFFQRLILLKRGKFNKCFKIAQTLCAHEYLDGTLLPTTPLFLMLGAPTLC